VFSPALRLCLCYNVVIISRDLCSLHKHLLNHFRTEQGHCGACRRKWQLTDIDLCPCGETQTMSHIVESCPLTKLNGDLSRLHSADEDAVSWLTSYGSWHAYEKKCSHRLCRAFLCCVFLAERDQHGKCLEVFPQLPTGKPVVEETYCAYCFQERKMF